jgi:Uma2 family endonuclease
MARPKSKLDANVRATPGTFASCEPQALSDAGPGQSTPQGQQHPDIVMREDLAAGGPVPATTQVADGLPRRAFTVDEVECMVEYGIQSEPEPFELIGGDLVAMDSKDRRHEVIRTELTLCWADQRARDLKVVSETPLRLGKHDAPEPDLIAFPASLKAPDVRADTELLVVEVANSSLFKDLNTKASRYAAAGVREYWVIDANSLATIVQRDPRPTGEFAHRTEHEATETLVPSLAPSLAVRLADLDLA